MSIGKRNCLILLNKPSGMTSNTAVNKVKYVCGAKKAGHLGTLDPLGTGILPVALNKATRLFSCDFDHSKTYYAIFSFGYETDTLDSAGKIVNENKIIVKREDLEKELKNMIGKINQLPPQFSAKKINGQKAYEIARKGGVVDLKTKEVEIFDAKVISEIYENQFIVKIDCSEGTYIRSIVRDVAHQLSTYGTISAILRTRYGVMHLNNSATMSELQNNHNVKVFEIDELIKLERLFLNDDCFSDLVLGRKICLMDRKPFDKFLVFCKSVLFGVGEINEENVLKIITNFFSGDING